MKLKEAIEHYEKIISECDNEENKAEYIQLKNWLIELQEYRTLYKNKIANDNFPCKNCPSYNEIDECVCGRLYDWDEKYV